MPVCASMFTVCTTLCFASRQVSLGLTGLVRSGPVRSGSARPGPARAGRQCGPHADHCVTRHARTCICCVGSRCNLPLPPTARGLLIAADIHVHVSCNINCVPIQSSSRPLLCRLIYLFEPFVKSRGTTRLPCT